MIKLPQCFKIQTESDRKKLKHCHNLVFDIQNVVEMICIVGGEQFLIYYLPKPYLNFNLHQIIFVPQIFNVEITYPAVHYTVL